MSAWIVDKAHIAALVRWVMESERRRSGIAWAGFDLSTEYGPEQLAGMLYAENVTSVNHRYAHHTPEEPVAFTAEEIRTAPRLQLVECIKACHCLAYQSCEHPEWKESKASRVLKAIESAAVTELPGYDDAPWGIEARLPA